MATQTLILNKTRPDALRTAQLDPYFRLLENLLAQIAKVADSVGDGDGISAGYVQAKIDELNAIISDTDPRLTADCSSLTADSDYISADIA
jgi:hypothetical protein